MDTFDLNYTVQADPKSPKIHYGFHVQGTDQESAEATLVAHLTKVIEQIGKPAVKKAVAKAPVAKKAVAKKAVAPKPAAK